MSEFIESDLDKINYFSWRNFKISLSKLKFDNILKLTLFNFFFSLIFLTPIIVFFYQSRGLNLFQIFALESILMLFGLLLEIPTGIFADRFGRKKSIIIAGILFLAEPIIFLFAHNFWPFAIAAATYGAGTAFASGCVEALIYDELRKTKQTQMMTKVMGSFGAAALFGAAVALIIGSIIAKNLTINAYMILIYLTITAGVIGWVFSFLLKEEKIYQKTRFTNLQFFINAMSLIKQNTPLKIIIFFETLTLPVVFVAVYLAQPYFLTAQIKVEYFGLIFTAGLLIDAFLRKSAHHFKKKFGLEKALTLSFFLPGFLYFIIAYVYHPIFSILVFILLRGSMGLRAPLISEYQNRLIPSFNRATILSVITMMVGAYEMIIIFLLGKIANFDFILIFKVLGIIIIIGSIFFALIIKRAHKLDQSDLESD